MSADETMNDLAAALTWAANRIEAELEAQPLHGRNLRAWWPVMRLRSLACDARISSPAGLTETEQQ